MSPDGFRAAVLNVDDDDQRRRYKTMVLQSAGFGVDEAVNGIEAIAQLESGRLPSLVLLDVQMPGLDGFEVCRWIRANPPTINLPVLQISAACVTDDDWARGLDAGADQYLIEPVAPEVLLGTIRRLLHRRRVEDELQAAEARVVAALRESEQRYRALFFHAPYGIYTVTLGGRILTANRALAQILGCETVDEVMALPASAFYHDPADRDAMVAQWRDTGRVDVHEARWRRQDGGALTVRLTGRLLQDEPAREVTFEVFVEDVTEQRRLEAERRHAHKMEAIGRLAAGIAHDFNNLLTAILGYTEMMLERTDDDAAPMRADLREVQRAGESAVRLTQQLLAFSRKQALRLEPLDLNAVVRASEQMLRRVIGEPIRVVLSLDETLPAIKADRGQLQQVLVNLAVNARDAMPDGGTLTIATRHVELRAATPFSSAVRIAPGRYAYMTVADTGCGMDADTQAHLFEPFFTTKDAGQGTGLGLATVYGIVKHLGGSIFASSAPGEGTTFHVYFPRTDTAVARPLETAPPAPAAIARDCILVVEDDEMVRAITVSMLARQGYRVVEAATPTTALALAADGADPIDLVLTDVVMPEMNGSELVRRIRSRRRIPVVYMSGYADPDVARQVHADGDILLAKPFTRADLLGSVHAVLERSRRAVTPMLQDADTT